MNRLADYFVIVGVSDITGLYHGKELKGDVLQRFPAEDRKGYTFPNAVQLHFFNICGVASIIHQLGLERKSTFCQPGGWYASVVSRSPTFYVAVLTDIEGTHSSCACLSFHESVTVKKEKKKDDAIHQLQPRDEKESHDDDNGSDMTYYIPKCLCLVARHDYMDALKSCTTAIYLAYINGEAETLEKMIGYALGFVHIPPPGGPKLSFSLGSGDNHVIYPPLSDTIPTTDTSVAVIFNQLGIHNMMLVFTSLVTENKLLLMSSSYTHLTLTAEALLALLYPLSFSYVYIPVLPSSLLDFLTAPTPFLMGVHTEYKRHIPELYDVVIVNIDEGYVIVPDSINLPQIPEPFYSKIISALKLILTPSLLSADLLFPPVTAGSSPAFQDKELRAVFINFFAEMFSGYRSCLTLIRVHPKPVISFNKIAFLERRALVGDDFFNKVLESVSFSTLVTHRGPPYRKCDLFDELVAKTECKPISDDESLEELMSKIKAIAEELYANEPGLEQTDEQDTVASPTNLSRESLSSFPTLDATAVESHIKENSDSDASSVHQGEERHPERVPVGTLGHPMMHYINKRRLEVIRDCVSYIFDNKISDARKALPSVLRALRSKGAQLALCNELSSQLKQNRSMLEHAQYDLVVRLMNASLQDDSSLSNTTVAAALVPLVCAFCRKLGPGVIQFAYSSVQEHPVWNSLQFWEEAFYAETQSQVVDLYLKELQQKRKKAANNDEKKIIDKIDIKKALSDTETVLKKASPDTGNHKSPLRNSIMGGSPGTPLSSRSLSNSRSGLLEVVLNRASDSHGGETGAGEKKPSAMELAAELLRDWVNLPDEEQRRLVSAEESIVYSLAMLFANRMVYLRTPLNAFEETRKYEEKRRRQRQAQLRQLASENESEIISNRFETMSTRTDTRMQSSTFEAASTAIGGSVRGDGSNSMNGSLWDSLDIGDGGPLYGDSIADNISKFILRFVERVCLEADITTEHLKSFQQLVPDLVSIHIDTINEVYKETKTLAPTQKAKIMKPTLLQGEVLQFDGLRCYLVADGRELGVRKEPYSTGQTPVADAPGQDSNVGADIGGPCLLPAEGAVFLTNYRIIFKGSPVDQYASEMMVTRTFPVGSLVKEKKTSGNFRIGPKQWAHECLQLRASTFQLLKLCFDEEVENDRIENFRKSLQKLRYPQSIYTTFAFSSGIRVNIQRTLSQRNQTIRKSQKTLTTVASVARKKVTQSRGGSLRKHKYAITDDNTKRRYESVNHCDPNDEEFSDGEVEADGWVQQDDVQLSLEIANRGMDKLSDSILCKEYERLGLGSLTKLVQGSPWRLSMANLHYTVCRSYPSVFIVPAKVSDDTIIRVAKSHRLNRFPVAVWRHRKTKGILLRSGGISRGVMSAVLKSGLGGIGSQGLSTASVTEDERFFSEIVSATTIQKTKKSQSISTGATLSSFSGADDFLSFESTDPFSRMVDDVIQSKSWEPSNLYIFSERALAKGTKFEATNKCNFVTTEVHDLHQVKTSFSKLLKICCPGLSRENDRFFHDLEESKWLHQISSVLQLACSVATLMEIQGSSCLVCFGDGSDVTTQVVSLAQVMLDPYYRTIEGFRVLLEKEWLSFGYRFGHRGNHIASVQSGLAPFFLQFLDGVHQILVQYPTAFEFNNYFLCFIAYHHVSMRFNTFMLDSEHERFQAGWTNDKSEEEKDEKDHSKPTAQSIWDYLVLHAKRLTMFQNFRYHGKLKKGALLPFCNVSNLAVWEYYTNENLYTGPTYDLEVISDMDTVNPNSESIAQGQVTAAEVKEDWGQCLMGCYGDTTQFVRDEASFLLSEIFRLREDLGQTMEVWRDVWEGLDVKQHLKQHHKSMNYMSAMWAREKALALHKRSTMEIVLRGKSTDSNTLAKVRTEAGFEHPHNFQHHNYLSQQICNYCMKPIQGFRAGLQCTECGYNVHEKCQSLAPTRCPKHKALVEQQAAKMSTSAYSIPGADQGNKATSNPKNYKGKLYKRGHLLRQWKARWFELDAQKNVMRYYDNEEDTQIQGYIDLGEMKSCTVLQTPQGAPKWADTKAFFELETAKRSYHLFAPDRETALEWVDRLNSLIA